MESCITAGGWDFLVLSGFWARLGSPGVVIQVLIFIIFLDYWYHNKLMSSYVQDHPPSRKRHTSNKFLVKNYT